MEESIKHRNDGGRSLLKKCFKNPLFSLVPFEIWRDLIVSNADLQSITLLSQTCHAFKEIITFIGENNFNLALMLRREGQIVLAKKYLLMCANNNISNAILHVGYGFFNAGWGLKNDRKNAFEWLKKSAESGNGVGMAFFALCYKNGYGVILDNHLCDVWGKKAIASNNPFAVAYCQYVGMGTGTDVKKGMELFQALADEGIIDEFGECMLGYSLMFVSINYEKAFYWFYKSALHGFSISQYHVGAMFRNGRGCERNLESAISWIRKSAKQGYQTAEMELLEIERTKK